MLFLPFTIPVVVICVLLVAVVQLIGSGRKTIGGMSAVGSGFIATLFYAAAFWVVASLMYAGVMAFGSIGVVGIFLSFIAIYLVMDVGVLIAIAAAAEGCSEPFKRFTGAGCSRSFWLSNFRWALMISWSAAFMYINEMYLPQTWWVIISVIIGMIACKVKHNVDAGYFDDTQEASAVVSSKLWHDFAVYGVQTALFLAIVLPYTMQSLIAGWGPVVLSWTIGMVISVLLPIIVGAVLSKVLPKGEPDYAKLFPAESPSSIEPDDDIYDEYDEYDFLRHGDDLSSVLYEYVDEYEDDEYDEYDDDDEDEYLDDDDDEDDFDILPPRRRRGR